MTDVLRWNRDKRIAIIGPYEYYISVMKHMGMFQYMKYSSWLDITTPAGFDHQKEYDILIVTALLSGESFDVFRNYSAYETRDYLSI